MYVPAFAFSCTFTHTLTCTTQFSLTSHLVIPTETDYDLVRIYHPDSPTSRSVPPETAHARFQAISAAYAVLSGKPRDHSDETDSFARRAGYNDLGAAMWKARQRRRAELNVGLDDRWKDRMMMGAILLVRVCISTPLSVSVVECDGVRGLTFLGYVDSGPVLLPDMVVSPTSDARSC